jgi:putative ABC transport system ATP-binding protein
MIKLEQLTMSYTLGDEQVNVLKGVDLEIGHGETVAIIGPSGSGKTTLLLLLAGLEQPAAGQLRIDGIPLSELNNDQLADLRRDKMGIIFQSFHLVPSLTALGNVALPIEISGRTGAREQARTMLEKVGLAARENHYPSQLSGGEQQRVAIARALVHSPKLALADEPTGNLDLRTGARVTDILFSLNREVGSTLVLVTHDEMVARRCQRVLRLQEGKLVEDVRDAIPA